MAAVGRRGAIPGCGAGSTVALVGLLVVSAWAGILPPAVVHGVIGSSGWTLRGPPTAVPPTFPTPIRHVFVVMLENEKQATVLASGPFEKYLTGAYASASHYYAVCHPSAPNYLGITSGAPWQCGSDSYKTHTTENLGDLAQKAGLTWAGFEESMPTACDSTDSYPYAVKHNPLVYYPDIVTNKTECKAHDVPFTNWTSDVANGTVPNLGIITPNLKDDGHDTGVAYADSWLKGWLSPLENDSFFQSSVFFVVYDESVNDNTGYNGTSGGNVYFSAVSPYAKAGYTLTTNASHYNLLTTIEWLLGLGSTGQNDSAAKWPPMKGLFNFTSTTASLSATASATPTSGVAPLNVSFTGSASGGTSPYAFAWTFGDGNSSNGSSTVGHRYERPGLYAANLTVTDTIGTIATASAVVDVADPALRIESFTATPSNVSLGNSTLLQVAAAGGTAPFTYLYAGLPDGCGTADAPTVLCQPSVAGAWAVTVEVTDSYGGRANGTVDLTVVTTSLPLEIVSFVAAPSTIRTNDSTELRAEVAGGSPPYQYDYSGLPPGCVGGDVAQWSCTPAAAGNFSVLLEVRDAAGRTRNASAPLAVQPAYAPLGTLVLIASPATLTLGQNLTLAVEIGGGEPPLSYAYSSPPGCGSADAPRLVCAPAESGTFNVSVTVADAAGARRTGWAVVTVTPPPHSTSPVGPAGVGVAPEILVGGAVAAIVGALLALGREAKGWVRGKGRRGRPFRSGGARRPGAGRRP